MNYKLNKYHIFLICLICGVILNSCCSQQLSEEYGANLENKERENEALRKQNDEINKNYYLIQDEIKNSNKKFSNLELKNKELGEKIQYFNNQIELKQDSLRKFYQADLNDKNKVIKEIITKNDTVYKNNYLQKTFNTGTVAIYCPREMYLEETYDAFGFISQILEDDVIKAKMIERIVDQEGIVPDDSLDGKELYTKLVKYHNSIKIEIVDSLSRNFDISEVGIHDIQNVSDNMKGWHWKIEPNSVGGDREIIFRIIIYKDQEVEYEYFRTFKIDVTVDPWLFVNKTKMLFIDNPQWAWTSVILPFISFLWGLYTGRKKLKSKLGPKVNS